MIIVTKINVVKPLNAILFLSIVLFTRAAYAQNYTDSLSASLAKYLNKTDIPGFSVVILAKNKIVYQSGFGYANIKSKQPFTPKTIHNIGSVSKTFIAVALMKAIELNYFSLETDINEILPFKVKNPYFPNEIIRIKDLTVHTSGIADHDTIYNRSYRFRKVHDLDKTLEGLMKERRYNSDLSDTILKGFLVAYLSPQGKLYSNKNFYNSKPGKKAGYSNVRSALAAYLIEVKSGMPFAEFSEKYLLKPLKMNQSGWFLTQKISEQNAVPYLNKQMAFPY